MDNRQPNFFWFCGVACILMGFLLNAGTQAQDDTDNESLLSQGITKFRKGIREWDGKKMTEAVAVFRRAADAAPREAAPYYWRGVSEFHLLLHLAGRSEENTTSAMKERLASSIKSLRKALKLDTSDGEIHAILASLLGMRIAHNPLSALTLGSKVKRHQKKALRLDPENPRVHYLMGSAKFHAPGIFGSKKKALKYFLKAEKFYKEERSRERDALAPRWGYGDCLAFIARTYEALDKPQKAKVYYRRALKVNPDNRLAREGVER
jgi:tetratricopeptide (TPR) repeat protein